MLPRLFSVHAVREKLFHDGLIARGGGGGVVAGDGGAQRLRGEKFGSAVLLKGGHSVSNASDLLCTREGPAWFEGRRIDNPNTHGTGCTLSSAIAANLAKGFSLPESIRRAKAYISGALAAMLDLGKGSGPMNHMFDLKGGFAE